MSVSQPTRAVERDEPAVSSRPCDRCREASSAQVFGIGSLRSSATCALHGLVSAELTPQELDHADRDYDVIVTVRAVKA